MARSAYFLFVFYEKQLFSRGRRHTRFFDAHVPEYVYAQKNELSLTAKNILFFAKPVQTGTRLLRCAQRGGIRKQSLNGCVFEEVLSNEDVCSLPGKANAGRNEVYQNIHEFRTG